MRIGASWGLEVSGSHLGRVFESLGGVWKRLGAPENPLENDVARH